MNKQRNPFNDRCVIPAEEIRQYVSIPSNHLLINIIMNKQGNPFIGRCVILAKEIRVFIEAILI